MDTIQAFEFNTVCRQTLSEIYSTFPKELFMEGLTNYEVLSLLVEGNLPKEKKNVVKEKAILESVINFYVENINDLSTINGNTALSNLVKAQIISERKVLVEKPPRVKAFDGGYVKPDFSKATDATFKELPKQTKALVKTNGQTINKNVSKFKLNKTGKYVAIGVILAGALYASYKIYKNYLSKAAKSCKGKSGKDKQLCMKQFKITAVKAQISQLRNSMAACSKTENPQLCKQKIQNKIETLEMALKKKLANESINLDSFGFACREHLLDLAESKTFIVESKEKIKFQKWIKNLTNEQAIQMVFEQKYNPNTQGIKDLDATRTMIVRFGLAAYLGGRIGGAVLGQTGVNRVRANNHWYDYGKHKNFKINDPRRTNRTMARGIALMAGGLLTMAAISLYDIYKTYKDPCHKKCEKEKGSGYTLCTSKCALVAAKRILSEIVSEKGKCRSTAKPDKCLSRMLKLESKWIEKVEKLEKRIKDISLSR